MLPDACPCSFLLQLLQAEGFGSTPPVVTSRGSARAAAVRVLSASHQVLRESVSAGLVRSLVHAAAVGQGLKQTSLSADLRIQVVRRDQ